MKLYQKFCFQLQFSDILLLCSDMVHRIVIVVLEECSQSTSYLLACSHSSLGTFWKSVNNFSSTMVTLQVSAYKYLIPYTNCIFALITNIVLLYLIQFHSRKIIGKYAHLMMCFTVYEMIYIISDVLISPVSWNFEKSNNFTNFIQFWTSNTHWPWYMVVD